MPAGKVQSVVLLSRDSRTNHDSATLISRDGVIRTLGDSIEHRGEGIQHRDSLAPGGLWPHFC